MDFYSHFSDFSAQNTATTFEYIKKFIHWIYANKFLINDGIIYDTTYGCSKQYRCINEIWLIYVLEFTHRLIIYESINSQGRVRRKIYGIYES